MNSDPAQNHLALLRRNPFWVCLVVFLVLAVDYGHRIVRVLQQRQQLARMVQNQAQAVTQFGQALSQQPQLEARLQRFSLDLLQVSQTNAAAQQIVQEFKISWAPRPDATPAANAPSGK